MPKFDGVRERQHQPMYDTLVRGIGISNVANNSLLFAAAVTGQQALTNMVQPGVLAADQTFNVKAIRSAMYFQSLADSEFAAYGTLTALSTNVTSTNSRAEDLYSLLAYGCVATFQAGDKPQFVGPLWYFPAGGGVSGFTTENSRHALSNGVPSQEAIMLLAKDIPVPARQNIQVQMSFFPFARSGNGGLTGNGQGGAIGADLSPLDYLNQFDGAKMCQVYLDGIRTRDVQ